MIRPSTDQRDVLLPADVWDQVHAHQAEDGSIATTRPLVPWAREFDRDVAGSGRSE